MLYRALAIVALIAATAGLFSCQQVRVNRATAALDRANAALASANTEKKDLAGKLELAQGTTRVVTEYVDRVQVVRERGDTITKEVPVYVTPTADAACAVPAGFVHIHDAAAAGIAPPELPAILMRPLPALRSLPSPKPPQPTTASTTPPPSR